MGTLRVAQDGSPGILDPYKSANIHSHEILWPIAESLFDVGREGALVPRLAERWDQNDELTYTFHLRAGVTFHGGAPLDAAAVVQNLQRAAGVNSFRGRILRDLIDVSGLQGAGLAVTVRLKYQRVDLLFLALITSPASLGTEQPLGTGPFRLQSRNNDEITLTANTGYWNGAPTLSALRFTVISSPSALATELLNGRIDHVRIADPPVLSAIGGDPGIQTRTVRPLGTYYLGFNVEHPALRAQEVRWAFGQAIDLAKLAGAAGLDPGAGPIPPHVEGYDPALAGPTHDPAQARTVLKAAALPPIPLLYSGDSFHAQRIAVPVKDALALVGVQVDLIEIPRSRDLVVEVMRRKQAGEPYVVIYNWLSILPAAELFLRPPFESEMRETNLTGYAGVDAILAAARTPMAPDERLTLYRQAQAKIVLDAPVIFVGHPSGRVSAHSTRVSGLTESNLNVQSFPVDRFRGVDV